MARPLMHTVIIGRPEWSAWSMYHLLAPAIITDVGDDSGVPIWLMVDEAGQDGRPTMAAMDQWIDTYAGTRHLHRTAIGPYPALSDSFSALARAMNDRYATLVVYCDWATQDWIRFLASRSFPNSAVQPIMVDRRPAEAGLRRLVELSRWPARWFAWRRARRSRPIVRTAPAR